MEEIIKYATSYDIPISAIKMNPYYNEIKQRVCKGDAIANKGWKDDDHFNEKNIMYYDNPANAYYLLISKANIVVLDIDIKGDSTAQEALTEEAYNRLFEASSYVVETGSKGLHFYFQSKEKLKRVVDVKQWKSWFRPGMEGAIDIITDYIIVEGSSYEYQGKTYTYRGIKPGATIHSITFHQDIWNDIKSVSTPLNEVIVPDETLSDIAPIQREAFEVCTKKITEVEQLVSLLSEERATAYDSWIKVAFVLKGLFYDLPDGLELFKQFSSLSYKYKESECEKAYRSVVPRTNGLTKKSLFNWAREDNPEKFKELFGFTMTWGSLKCINQNEMAKCFIGLVKQDYVYSEGIWFRYTDQNTLVRLAKTHPDALKSQVSDCLQEEAFRLVKSLDKGSDTYTACLTLAGNAHKTFGSSQWINGVIDFIRSLYTDDELYGLIDTNMNLLAFSNGFLFDYGTKTIRKILREDNIMKTTKKPLTQQRCEQTRAWIMAELKNIFDSDEVVHYWLETIAMALFRNNFEKLYCHTGSGGNGKGVLFGMIKEALGEYYYQAPNEFLTTTYKADAPNSTLANARGIRIFMTSEPSSENSDGRGMKLGTDLIKALTGGDDINARDLYASAKSPFTPTFTSILQCNTIPDFTKIDGGLRRRFDKIDYPNKFVDEPTRKNEKKIDYNLKQKTREYAVVNEFMLLLWDIAKEFTEFHRPESVKKSTSSFLNDADKVLCWIEDKMEKCAEIPSVEERISKAEAVRLFMADMETRITPKKFHDQMKVNEIDCKKIRGTEYYYLKRKAEEEE